MKLTRAQFLKALPAAALVLAGCTAAPTAPADTDELVFDHTYPLDYATQFTADCYADGSTLLTIPDAQAKFLVRPEGAATLRTVPEGVTVLQQPLQNLYLVSTSVMDLFLALDALDCIALSGTRAEGWYLDEARQAMLDGRIAYAGKYSAPDYEQILAANCGLAIENTMIYHTPEVKEQLERFGIPVLVERSSYESGPLAAWSGSNSTASCWARRNWHSRCLTDRRSASLPCWTSSPPARAARSFLSRPTIWQRAQGRRLCGRMIEMAGADYVFADLTDNGNSLSTMNLPLEDFYAGARDADFLIYNSTIEGVVSTTDELVAKCSLLADFKAVQNGHVWCVAQSFFQQSMELADFILELHRLFTEDAPDGLQYFIHVE